MNLIKHILITLFVLLYYLSNAQSRSQDSLLLEAKTTSNVYEKLRLLNEYCYGFRRTDREKGRSLAEILYQSAIKLNSKESIADYYFLRGTFIFQENQDSSIFFFRKAITRYSRLKIDVIKFSRALNNLVSIYQYKSEYDSSLKYSLLANTVLFNHPIPENKTFHYRLAINYKSIADGYCYKSLLDSSILNYERAERYARLCHDTNALALSLQNKANIFNLNEQYVDAAQILLEVIPLHKSLNNFPELVNTYSSTGNYYAFAKMNDLAFTYIDSAMKLASIHEVDRYLPYNYLGLGTIYFNQKLYSKAFENYKKGLDIAREIENYFAEKSLLLGLGEASYELADYPNSIKFFNETLETRDQYREHNMLAYKGLSLVYEKVNDHSNALKYSNLYHTTKDSIYNLKKHLIINQVGQQSKNITNEQTIQKLKEEKDAEYLGRNKEFYQKLIAIAILVLVLIIAYLYFKFYRLKKENEKEALIIQERLRISRDLHDDLGATISSINIYSSTVKQKLHENKIDETEKILDKISEEAQDMVYGMSDMVWTISPHNDTIEKLINRIHNYGTDIMQAKDIQFKLEYDPQVGSLKLSMEQRRNIFLILKEAINNLVKYSNATEAILRAYVVEHKICIELKDFGQGFNIDLIDNKNSGGNGLRNIQQRASEIQAELYIDSVIGVGTSIRILINPTKNGGLIH